MATPTYRSATLDLACCYYGFKDFQVSVSWLFKAVANMLHGAEWPNGAYCQSINIYLATYHAVVTHTCRKTTITHRPY